jgi:multidrug resistance efflux pump
LVAALLLLGYAAIGVVVFKLLRVPINKWTITTAGIGGVVVVGGLLAGMNYNHPFTNDGRIYFYTTPIVPTVQGTVVEVTVKPNAPMERGDVLFRIDPKPYQYIVDQKRALLAEADQNVKELKTSLQQATAVAQRAQAQVDLAQQNYDRQQQLFERKVTAQAALDTASRNLEAARQSLAGAQAARERARLALESNVDGVNTAVARLQADLRSAEYNLAQATVTAPTDGYVAQMLLRPGMTVSPATPTMVFIHSKDVVFSASFAQNAVSRVVVGNQAEAAFDAIPGRVFSGKVAVLSGAVSQGELHASGTLLNPEDRSKSNGRMLVRIDLSEDMSKYRLPLGAVAQVAVYSDHWRPVAAIRRILLRMKSWINYLI